MKNIVVACAVFLSSIFTIFSCQGNNQDISTDNELLDNDFFNDECNDLIIDEFFDDSDSVSNDHCILNDDACLFELDARCSSDLVEICRKDTDGCKLWYIDDSCESTEKCEGPGICVSKLPVIYTEIKNQTDSGIEISVVLDQPSEDLLPRIIDLNLIKKNLIYINGSDSPGEAALNAGKEIKIIDIEKDKLRIVVQGFNSKRIYSGTIVKLKFRFDSKAPYILYPEKKEEIFTPPAADMNASTGGLICISDCGDRECGSNGCGGSCGSCNENEICGNGGYCTEK